MPCSPGMTKCKRGCLHRIFVGEYQAARYADEERRENRVGVYGPDSQEWAEYTETRPLMTFRDWLIQTKGWNS